MIKIIPRKERYFSDMGNMNSYFLFSFADYYDTDNESFGNLRVFNDDFVGAKNGFPMHPHKYYEILTLMLDGTITHKDSLGNKEKISKNQIQVTNTANGIFHSEINEENEDLKLYQIWFMPDFMVKEPIYYTANLDEKDYENNLFTIASGIEENKNKLTSNIEIKRGIFDEGKKLELKPRKYFFLYITSGKIKLNDLRILETKDQLRVTDEEILKLEFLEKTDFVVIESL